WRIHVTSFDAACAVVAAGLGVRIIPRGATTAFIRPLALAALPLTHGWAARLLLLCAPAKKPLHGAAQLLVEHLRAAERRYDVRPIFSVCRMSAIDESPASQPYRRSVRSFVIRRGRATVAQQRALDALWPKSGIELDAEQLDLDAAFGRKASTLIEIGFGAGEALLSFAQANPAWNCLGIEVHPPGVGHLLLGIERAQLLNVRVIMHDAVEVLSQHLPPASIA